MGYVKMTSYIELKNIEKSYPAEQGTIKVLKNIKLQIKKNEFVTILGPSGCGKSTLLKIIAGFLKAEKGKILKKEKEIKKANLDRVMLFQDFEQLFPWQTVLNNIIFAVKAASQNKKEKLNKKEIESRALNYLKEVKLASYRDYYPHQLSGGMKQRVALARTLASESEIMLMDEPFGSVDSQTRRELQHLLNEIWQEEEKTVIFVTHDIREAVFLADKIVLMKNEPGEIIAEVENNLSRPRNRNSLKFNQLFEQLQYKLEN
jgi:NitT/TauT family transport system ATP-binding protein